jgi:hypothetical protein
MPSKLEKTLHYLLKELVREIGFEPVDSLSFSRTTDGCHQSIDVPTRMEGGKLKFTCMLGVRFDELESLLTPNSQGWDSGIGCPIHLLRPEREYYEWEGGDEEELTIAVKNMIAEIHDVGFQFFERFKTIEAVEEELSSSVASDQLILSPHQRTCTLAAIALAHGERSTAEALFADALNDPRNQNPGRRQLLQELRTQLFAD